jgi:hypothetical protein
MGKQQTGVASCSQTTEPPFGACRFPPPALHPRLAEVLYLFSLSQSQWERSGFDGALFGIPVERVERKARARGIEVDEFFSDAWEVAESVLMGQDRDRRRPQQES